MIKLSKDLELPADLVGRRTAIFGISGSGKSNTATVIVEELLAQNEQVVLIDPKGEGYGLLSKADGKPSNLNMIVFGQPHGHLEIHESHGTHLADFVVETGQSVVLNLLGFESDQAERRLVATFLRQLYRRKSQQQRRSRLLVVLDEAHLFIPESQGRGYKGDAADLAGACQRIVRQGRAYGVGTLLVDQRPQDVAKRVLTQCDTLICHQLIHNLDRDALSEWVRGYDKENQGKLFLDSISSLTEGDAWVWSPGAKLFHRTHVRRRWTFDSGAAPDGGEASRKVQRADVDLDKLKGKLTQVVEEAKANDPQTLKERIKELEKEAKRLQTVAPKAKGKPVKATPAITAEDHKVIRIAVSDMQLKFDAAKASLRDLLNRAIGEVDSRVGCLEASLARFEKVLQKIEQYKSPTPAVPPSIRQAAVAAVETPVIAGKKRKPHERILDALVWWESLGVTHPDRMQVGLIADVHASGGYFDKVCRPLVGEGCIDRGDGVVCLLPKGRQLAQPAVKATTLAAYHAILRSRLKGDPTHRVFDALVDFGNRPSDRATIGDAANVHHTGGYFDKTLRPLATMGLVDRKGGRIHPTPLLFPPQLR